MTLVVCVLRRYKIPRGNSLSGSVKYNGHRYYYFRICVSVIRITDLVLNVFGWKFLEGWDV